MQVNKDERTRKNKTHKNSNKPIYSGIQILFLPSIVTVNSITAVTLERQRFENIIRKQAR